MKPAIRRWARNAADASLRTMVVAGLLASASCQRESADATAQAPAVTVTDAQGRSVQIADTSRIVSVGGGVTEIVFALGAGARVVGVDTSSIFPEAATRLPKVGYQRQLSAEGALALRPTLVIANADAGPAAAMEQLRTSGVTVLIVPAEHTIDGARTRIRTMAQALRRDADGAKLLAALDLAFARARAHGAELVPKPRVLFIYARGQGTVNVSGRGTAADEMIRLAGGENAVAGFEGFRPLTAEASVTAAPDVILIPSKGLESIGSEDALFGLPGLGLTPAGQHRRVIQMDDLLLLGFGPRTGQAVEELVTALHANAGGETSVSRGEGQP